MPTKRKNRAHKQCSCQSTNCLKCYCICFAAEKYCTEACACKECFNELDYKNKVDKAREEAEVRNPFAFSTKEGQDTLTATVKKQKRGCECRLSMCLNEKCKCYQAKVGCRIQCHCKGCKNDHGKRGDNNNTVKMIETGTRDYSDMAPVDQLKLMNQLTSQDRNLSSVINFPYNIPSPLESLNPDMMIGTTIGDSDIVPLDQLEFRSQFTTQNINIPYIQSLAETSNPDMMIETSTLGSNMVHVDQPEFMKHFTPQNMNIPYILPFESSNPNTMIGTSSRDSVVVPVDQLEFINQCTPQDTNARHPNSVTNFLYINPPPAGSSNLDMMIGTSTRENYDMVPLDQLQFMNQFIPEDINARHLSSVTNPPCIPSAAGSSNCEMMRGTSTRDYDMDLPTVDQLEFMNRFIQF